MNAYTELKKILKMSSIGEDKQNKFYNTLSLLPEEEILSVVKLFKEDTKWISLMYDNYKKKEVAFKANNISNFESILSEEKELLNMIS